MAYDLRYRQFPKYKIKSNPCNGSTDRQETELNSLKLESNKDGIVWRNAQINQW